MNKLTITRTCVYNINYHIVWAVKYRHKILNPLIENRIKEIFKEVGEEDHIHIFVSAHPKIAPSYIVKMLKVYLLEKYLLSSQN